MQSHNRARVASRGKNGIHSVQRDEVPEIRHFTNNYCAGWVGKTILNKTPLSIQCKQFQLVDSMLFGRVGLVVFSGAVEVFLGQIKMAQPPYRPVRLCRLMPKIHYTPFPVTSPQTGKLRTCCGLVGAPICRCNGIWETTRHDRHNRPSCCRLVVYVVDLLRISYGETLIMDFSLKASQPMSRNPPVNRLHSQAADRASQPGYSTTPLFPG